MHCAILQGLKAHQLLVRTANNPGATTQLHTGKQPHPCIQSIRGFEGNEAAALKEQTAYAHKTSLRWLKTKKYFLRVVPRKKSAAHSYKRGARSLIVDCDCGFVFRPSFRRTVKMLVCLKAPTFRVARVWHDFTAQHQASRSFTKCNKS